MLDLDLAALGAGRSPGLTPARRAACSASAPTAATTPAAPSAAGRSRPALAAAHPEETWEVSHIGGDRFAGNLLVLPHGLYYGRLDPATALARRRRPRSPASLDLDHLRGRSGLADAGAGRRDRAAPPARRDPRSTPSAWSTAASTAPTPEVGVRRSAARRCVGRACAPRRTGRGTGSPAGRRGTTRCRATTVSVRRAISGPWPRSTYS